MMTNTEVLMRSDRTETIPREATDARRNSIDTAIDPSDSYDGSDAVFRLLRLATWGSPLMNLGYFGFRGPFAFLNTIANVESAQHRLVRETVDLLDVKGDQRVLDVACGRGKSSYIIQCLNPAATVVGLDLLEHHIDVATTLFGNTRNLSYVTGNAMLLDFPDESFDRVMCLEAAFHFPDRGQFLSESFRVLRPGGRLVVVDFAWNTDADRMHRDDPETRQVRKIWQWDDLSSVSEYERTAARLGFVLSGRHDWSKQVTRPIQTQLRALTALTKTKLGRFVLRWRNPLFVSCTPADWKACESAVAAHDHVQRHSKYMAFVFEKP